MDLANLKNLDLNDIFKKLKSGGFSDKKILIKFGEIFNWLWVVLIAVIILNVVLRYVFRRDRKSVV